MFPKPAFGSNASGFGSFSSNATTASPFSGFKAPGGTSAFGAPPAFGAAASTQPSTGGGLFGTTNTTGGLFGGTSTAAAPTFGNTSGGFGFNASTSSGGGLFNSAPGGGLFGGTPSTSAFGAKPAGFGFGGATTSGTTGGLFGTTPSSGTGLFGPQPNTLGGGGLFSNNTGAFGPQQTANGTAHVKYNPVVGTDVVMKSGSSQSINIKHHCITCMKEYENKSLEELRLEDYTAGRKGSTSGMFGGFQQTDNKPLFGGSTFSQPTTTASSVFGAGGMGTTTGFGQTNTFSFGGNTQANNTNTSGLFGAAKPTFGAAATPGTGLFGTTTTQAPSFGTTTPSFGFGTTTQNQSGGLFGAKPPTTGFGTTPVSSGFGAFGTGGGGLFAAKPTVGPAFGTAPPPFGTLPGGFGTNTSTAGGGLFSNSFKPATTQSYGFNAPATGLGGGLGTGLGTSFQPKPATQPFGLGGGSSIFQTPTVPNFSSGLDSGLGGGLFSGTTLGSSPLNLGNNTLGVNNNLAGASAAGNVHEQILSLVARPYGDSPLFKDLVPDTSTATDDVLKPTNPAAVKAVLDSNNSAYRLTSPNNMRLRVQPLAALTHDKKSLFDGLEESDASLEDKLTLKPSRKRLNLRPKSHEEVQRNSPDRVNHNRSSLEDPVHQDTNGLQSGKEDGRDSTDNGDEGRRARDNSYSDNNKYDAGSNRFNNWPDKSPRLQEKQNDINPTSRLQSNTDGETRASRFDWLNSSRQQNSNEKEKPVDGEATPRIYPNLDKEIPIHISERRASWLTTKPLRKPLAPTPDSAENSVRDLGLRSERQSHDKENIDTLSVSEEEHVAPQDAPPHPAGVRLTRPGYYTIPSLDDMIKYITPDGSCVLPHFTIGRMHYGNVYYDCELDVAGLDLDALVHFMNKEVTIYPDDANKPPIGEGLNRRAIVTLDGIWPRDKTEKRPITDPERLLAMEYEGKLRRVCDKHDTKFIEYRPQTGSWVFRVEHFSKYSLTDSDEEDAPTPEVMKRQLVNQQLQKAAPPAPPNPPAAPGLGGLGGLSTLGPYSAPTLGLANVSGMGAQAEDSLFAMQQTSLNLLNGAGKAFEMDTTEDNAESQSLYQDHRAYGVKSPTSELARLEHRQSHNVQLMKASLYADAEVEDDMSVSTGDQLVPRAAISLLAAPRPPSAHEDISGNLTLLSPTEELPMNPLIVRPHTVVLKYHRKVPPFKQTIAGRLDAAYIADMCVCRARHTRTGFGPAGAMVYATSYDAINDLPRNAELCDISKYIRGRAEDDWSEPVVARLAIGQAENASVKLDILSRHLETLLEYSIFSEAKENECPRLSVRSSPQDRSATLQQLISDFQTVPKRQSQFGVSTAYCYEVFRLCEALWGADLENNGVPGTDEQSIVNRHRCFLEWLKTAVSDVTDQELLKPRQGEPEDEADGHSERVWTLLLGGRLLEACKVAREHGDLNMATLIAQAAGDPLFRSLISRQLSLWRECGADGLISTYRRATLQLIAGITAPREELASADWLRALHATARYLCPQVPSLEQVVRTYESLFPQAGGEDAADLSVVSEGQDEMGMRYPLPPYLGDYDVTLRFNGKKRRVLDLRYELIRARAMNSRPKLHPAAYTPDPMDYSLCFILGAWLGNPSPESVIGLAEQLEAYGSWHLAVQVLAYHPNERARGHLIRGVLGRHAPARAGHAELAERVGRVRHVRVPTRWLLLAQAHRAGYERLPAVEAEHLVGAEQWNAAHRVLLEELLPEAVLADNLKSISPLLEALNEAAQRHEVSGWESGGQALHHYLHVCDEIRGLVSSAETSTLPEGMSARLEALRPRVWGACRALGRLKTTTPRHAAARSEMGARLLHLALAAGEPPHQLTALLKALKLPPDCTAQAQHKITTDLAEQASDICIDSETSSPLSSINRTAVDS